MAPVAIPGFGGEAIGSGVDRRSFVKIVTMAAASVGLPLGPALKMAEAAVRGVKPSVIWLHFQECTGCTETLLRTSHPGLAEVILDLVSLDYHETLMAASGKQAEQSRHDAMEKNAGKYVLVVEGSIPVKDGGIYCQIGGRTAMDILKEASSKAGAVIALGSCASWGGIASAEPNPTGATGVPQLVKDKPVVSLPGCPSNPYVFLGTVLQYVALGKLPQLDDKGRPLFAYGRTIHEHCPRRAHFDAGRFAEQFGDKGHEQGWCLYKLGCKGPQTHASCSTLHFGEMTDAWPIGMGHPCVGCTEQEMLWKVAIHDTVPIDRPAPPDTYPPIRADHRNISPVATGVAGILGGAAVGAAWRFAKKVDEPEGSETREDTGAGGRP